ncbi:hypothetical protein LNV09_14430 [Paucibacter sp. B2R-40]|uniref:hypothetical protein n=1 Tax=Paucibacter sp. B2R-40 TaxID=2893554 RepID=UPI0021E36778|nr:hypothetical protein [Paucibacter sp. B2R-40]MCV2355347.1 hypothetical protein [Paucibacter sp. B2R-40]
MTTEEDEEEDGELVPVDLEALAQEAGVSAEVLRAFAVLTDAENAHLFAAKFFLRRKNASWRQQRD